MRTAVIRTLVGAGFALAGLLVPTHAPGAVDVRQTPRVVAVAGYTEVVEVRATVDGIPVLRPVARRLMTEHGELLAEVEVRAVPELVDPTVRVDQAGALARLEASGLAGSRGGVVAELVAVPGPRHTRLVWRVDPPADRFALVNRTFLVDASTGAITVDRDRAFDALARSFERNPIRDAAAADHLLNFIDEPVTGLIGPYFEALNCIDPMGGPLCQPWAVPPSNMAGDFLYPAPDVDNPDDNTQLEDEFAAVSVYFHADKFQRFVLDRGWVGTRCHEMGMPNRLVANYKAYADDGDVIGIGNAAFLGQCDFSAIFGQGNDADWGYDGDVVYHELTHGLVDQRMGPDRTLRLLRPRTEGVLSDAGAINEGIADFLANVVGGDSLHGDYVATIGSGSGRDAINEFTCPSALTGEVHADSQPLGAVLWEAHDLLGDGVVDVVMDTVSMLPEDATFEETAMFLEMVAAASMGDAAAQTLRELLDERNLVDCPRLLPAENLERGMIIRPKGADGPYLPMRPPPMQLSFEVPADMNTMRVDFDIGVSPLPGFAPISELNVLIGEGAPIAFSYEPNPEGGFTVDAAPDQHLAGIAEGFEVTVAPGQTVYAAFFEQGPNTVQLMNVRATFSNVPTQGTGDGGDETGADSDDGGDAGADGDGGGGDGCSCRSGSSGYTPGHAPGHALPLALLLLGVRRRRRVTARR